jgi:hypothetical protein
MKAALRDSYIDYVIFMGVTEKYPRWFRKLLDDCTYTDESRFTIWVDKAERRPDYYEKQLIETYSVVLRKHSGEVHITDYDVFNNLYVVFRHDEFTNSGLAAYEEDCIEYVECHPGVHPSKYPEWFYEYYTEAINFPPSDEGIILLNNDQTYELNERSVVLRNRFGEIKLMPYKNFRLYYDDSPSKDRDIFMSYYTDNGG